ncbi:MAG TPA: pinensin family lanthipeptide [Luteibaculaceae bacterium]|nr:pinensin family lanthipeptide [Luteibaculaceae bacterium]
MKKKIKLTDLKVQSFVTALSEEEKVLAVGGEAAAPTTTTLQTPNQTFSLCGYSACQMGTICTRIHETKLLTCIYCKPKT